MLKLPRVCVPICMECNFHCSYCYRAVGRADIPEFNSLMRRYLRALDPTWCRGVIASGGEPLLHMGKVYELFSYVPKGVAKKVLTNGWELTEEFVEWANQNSVEIQISHDGAFTKQLRGIDVLDYPDVRSLVHSIKLLRINGVATAKNPDPYENYHATKAKLGKDFLYFPQAIFADDKFPDLSEGFDYSAYSRGCIKLFQEQGFNGRRSHSGFSGRSDGFNVLPDGTVVGMPDITKTYGTVADDYETLLKNKHALGDDAACLNHPCRVRNECQCASQIASPHSCACVKLQADAIMFVKSLNSEDGYAKPPHNPRCW